MAAACVHWGMSQEDVVSICSAVVFGQKREWPLAICCTLGEPRKYYAEGHSQTNQDTMWCPWFVQSNTQNQWSNTPKSNRLIDTGRKRGLPSPLLSYQKSDAFGLSILDTWGESAMAELSLTASHTLHPPCLAWNIAVLSVFSRNCLMFHVGWCSVCSRARFHDTVPGTGVMGGWILRRIRLILELWVS